MAGALAAAFLGFAFEPDPRPPQFLAIQYVISPDAEEVLTPLISEFNGERMKSNGKVIRVTTLPESSGRAAAGIGHEFRPVIWTPASSAWAEMVDKGSVEIGVRTLFQSPEVLAVWKTEADRLHLGSSIQFKKLADLVASHELAFGHTDPGSSTSGLFAVVSEFSFYSGKRPADLTLEDLSHPRVAESVRNFEWNTVHYVDIGRDFADEWCQYGFAFASAAYMQETTLIGFNRRCRNQVRAVYVTDYPFVADYPYLVLTGSWVSEEEGEAADVFGAWLKGRLAADPALAKSGFRSGDEVVPSVTSGADPMQPASPPPALPDAALLRAMQDGWSQLRRAANVMLVVDESQPMAIEGREELAREALRGALACPGTDPEADDRVGMITFGGGASNLVHTKVPIADFDRSRKPLEQAIAELAARGRAALWDAVERALRAPALDDSAPLRTIVLLASGEDDSSSVDPRELEAQLRNTVDQSRSVQVLVVPYGKNIRSLMLLRQRLVAPSLGRYFDRDISDIADVTKFICAFE